MNKKKEKKAIIYLFIGMIGITAFALSNAYYHYTTREPYMDIAHPPNFALGNDFVNDTVKAANITTTVDEITNDEDGNMVVKFSHLVLTPKTEIDYFQCIIDNKDWGECSSPLKVPLKDYQDNKTHTLEIRAIDMEGNAEANPIAILFPINNTEIIK